MATTTTAPNPKVNAKANKKAVKSLEAAETNLRKMADHLHEVVATFKEASALAAATKPAKAKDGSSKPAKAKAPKAPKASRKGSRHPKGWVLGKLTEFLGSASEPTHVKEIASSIGIPVEQLHVWFSTTGKNHPEIKKVAPATYALRK